MSSIRNGAESSSIEYCDANRLTTHERLELFVPVCQVVHDVHQKGIIHRDIKPTNILVSEQDGRPAPKIIDFGVAKAIGLRLTDKTLNTRMGLMVGTPGYISPEQAEMGGRTVDATTGICSLRRRALRAAGRCPALRSGPPSGYEPR